LSKSGIAGTGIYFGRSILGILFWDFWTFLAISGIPRPPAHHAEKFHFGIFPYFRRHLPKALIFILGFIRILHASDCAMPLTLFEESLHE